MTQEGMLQKEIGEMRNAKWAGMEKIKRYVYCVVRKKT